jgi:anti-sigma B factor antagonist
MTDSTEPDRLNSVNITIEGDEDLTIRPWKGPPGRQTSPMAGAGGVLPLGSCNTLIVNDEDVTVLPWRRTAANETGRQDASANSKRQRERAVSGSTHGSFQRFALDIFESVAVVAFVDNKITTEEDVRDVIDELSKLVDEGNTQILLNFSDVHYMSGSMMGKLISLKRRISNLKGKLKLCCIRPDVFEVFSISRLDQVFEIYADEQSALESP